MAGQSCNQNNDILVRAEIRRSATRERREGMVSGPWGQSKLHWAQLPPPPLLVRNMEISNITVQTTLHQLAVFNA